MKTKTPAVDHFADDLTAAAWQSHIRGEPRIYVPRDDELRQLLRVLSHRSHSSPVLVGASGVGKTALVHALAEGIARGEVPVRLRSLRVLRLDLTKMLAGTKYRGQLEERLKAVQNEAEQNPGMLLFLDDIEMVRVYSYESEALLSMLQSSIANHSVQWITTATPESYREFQAKHPLYSRAFNIVRVNPTSPADTLRYLQQFRRVVEAHYCCEVTDKALETAVSLAKLYLPWQATPGSAFEVLDEAGSVVTLRESYQQAADAGITDLEKEYTSLQQQIEDHTKNEEFMQAANLRKTLLVLSARLKRRKTTAWDTAYTSNREAGIVLDEATVVEAVANIAGLTIEQIRSRSEVPAVTVSGEPGNQGIPEFERLQTRSILHGDGVAIRRGTAFVLLPHTPEFRAIFDNIIRPASEANGLTAMKAEDIYNPGSILAQVWEAIRSAEVIIADVSGKNPNVIYELGLCYGIQRCPILLTRDPGELPFNLRNLRYLNYDATVAGTADLKVKLTAAIQEFLAAVRMKA